MAVPDNLKITKGTRQVIMTIEGAGVKENWTKSLNIITPPKTTGQQDDDIGANITRIIDILNKAERRITFSGSIGDNYNRALEQSKNKDGDIITDATDVLNVLREIFFGGGTFVVNWNGADLTCNADKISADWAPNDKDTITSYSVVLTLIVGQD